LVFVLVVSSAVAVFCLTMTISSLKGKDKEKHSEG
jgi:hypothetical protein